jgi:UDP:flavonoid glycosyltransferase YjiC (YdhE family)
MAQAIPIAVFVSPHGYGHAARACALMEALAEIEPDVRFEVFTRVPEWFFADSLACSFAFHPWLTDVGLVQTTPLVEDADETLRRLDEFLPFAGDDLDALARLLGELGCRLALCDISPLGLAVARRAGIPSVLVENFTWDWIYEPYARSRPAFARHIAFLAEVFAGATLHIQAEPACLADPGSANVPPVSRMPRSAVAEVRARLGVPAEARMVLVTMGGIPWEHGSLRCLEEHGEAIVVVPGGSERPERRGALLLLPHRSGFFHPDLVHASDAVIGKLGYSTLAEVYVAGVPFGYVGRPTFRESVPLAAFVAAHMPGLALAPDEITGDGLRERLPQLLALSRTPGSRSNGAAMAAIAVQGLLGGR